MRVLRRGAENRHVGETRLNRESSRSHSVFTCVIERHSRERVDDGGEPATPAAGGAAAAGAGGGGGGAQRGGSKGQQPGSGKVRAEQGEAGRGRARTPSPEQSSS
jgi:hypothetical protein